MHKLPMVLVLVRARVLVLVRARVRVLVLAPVATWAHPERRACAGELRHNVQDAKGRHREPHDPPATHTGWKQTPRFMGKEQGIRRTIRGSECAGCPLGTGLEA